MALKIGILYVLGNYTDISFLNYSVHPDSWCAVSTTHESFLAAGGGSQQ